MRKEGKIKTEEEEKEEFEQEWSDEKDIDVRSNEIIFSPKINPKDISR